MSVMKVDLDLVKKYNVPGPRYTSYPPATQFTNDVSPEILEGKIRQNNQATGDLSLYFHLPFCQTLCWFCGCTTVITLNHSQGMTYVEALGREVAKMAPLLNQPILALALAIIAEIMGRYLFFVSVVPRNMAAMFARDVA